VNLGTTLICTVNGSFSKVPAAGLKRSIKEVNCANGLQDNVPSRHARIKASVRVPVNLASTAFGVKPRVTEEPSRNESAVGITDQAWLKPCGQMTEVVVMPNLTQ